MTPGNPADSTRRNTDEAYPLPGRPGLSARKPRAGGQQEPPEAAALQRASLPLIVMGAALLLSGCAVSYELRLPAGLVATAGPYITSGDDDDGPEGGGTVSVTWGEP